MLAVAPEFFGTVAKLCSMSEHNPMPQPPRRIPPHILRRRRIIAVILVLVILGLIGWGIWAVVGALTGDDEGTGAAKPTVTESASPSPSATADDDETSDQVAACPPEFLQLTGSTDQESYGDGEIPTLTMTITHEGDVLCNASVGSDQQNFVVEDANGEFVFATRACQVEPQEQVVEMEPGQSETATFAWERVGTDEACEIVVEDLSSGQYQLVVSLGERTAEPVPFTLE